MAADDRGLAGFRPFLTAANVRPRFDPTGLLVGDGRGQAGDLVLGELCPGPEPVVVRDQSLVEHTVSSPTRVLAPLGTRESSTHLNGGLPPGGLAVHEGLPAHWLAGESGLVGMLWAEGRPTPSIEVETSERFRCIGLVRTPDGRSVNIDDFALSPPERLLDIPIIAVAATSAEAGKTVLAQKVVAAAVGLGLRTAAIKVTGTGGTVDSSAHRSAGADIVLDQVDGGLITTYCDADTFRKRIVRPFRHARDLGAEVVIAELGGDLVYANNPTFLAMREMVARLRMLMVVNNDALSCLGTMHFLERDLAFPIERVRLFSSPFRSFSGQAKRMPVLGLGELCDPDDRAQVGRLVREALAG